MEYKNSFVLYESVFKQYERLLNRGKEREAQSFIGAVMEYGLYGELPDEKNEVWDYGLHSIIASINSAKQKRNKKIEIPQEELEEKLEKGLTQQQIADYYKCSVDTVQRRMDEYGLRKNRKPQAPQGTANIPQKGRTQFNVNVNDNENENGNVYDNNHFSEIKERVSF